MSTFEGFDSAMAGFVRMIGPTRVIFGTGSVADVPAEVDLLGSSRVLLVAGGSQARQADTLSARLGARLAGRFTEIAMHVPVEIARRAAEAARASRADLVLCLGGGSATGAAKAIALETGLPILAVPTTYAGSEMTSIWGLTENGHKRTGRDARAQPVVVVYDPELTVGLPADVSAASAMNGLAHLVEGLYSPDSTAQTNDMAEEGVRALALALPLIVADPTGLDARVIALYGAWLAGSVLGSVRMGIHHKICHVLGGSFDLPHSGVHSAVLPYVMAFNADDAPVAMSTMRRALVASGLPDVDAPTGVWNLGRALGAPGDLASLGMLATQIRPAVLEVMASPAANPRSLREADVEQLLRDALAGATPRAYS